MAIRNARIAVAALGISTLTIGAQAQTPAEFFRDKTLTIQVGYGAGGGYDMTTRIVARHLGKHIPAIPPSSSATCRAPAACVWSISSTTRRRKMA